MTAEAIESDPYLSFEPDPAGVWAIRERDGSRDYRSAMDDSDQPRWSDAGYLGRLALPRGGRTLLVIAGVHALGSVGVVDYLAGNLPDLYARVGTRRFSTVVGSDHAGETVTRSELLCDLRTHE